MPLGKPTRGGKPMTDVPKDDLRRAQAMTARLARGHYENFLVSSILLPRPMRQPFFNVYAFCRTADDAADESKDPTTALAKLDGLRGGLVETYAGHPPDDLFIALGSTIDQFQIPQKLFCDLLDAFVQDQSVNRYHDDDSLVDYCRRSADPVGRIVLRMGEADSEENVRLSDHICTALQMVNFWQDVSRDYRMGRVYIPISRWHQHGLSPEILAELPPGSSTPPAMRAMIRELCDDVDQRMSQGRPLVQKVPAWLSDAIELFIGGGLATCQAIRKIDYDVCRIRPRVSKWTQFRMVGAGIRRRFLRRRPRVSDGL